MYNNALPELKINAQIQTIVHFLCSDMNHSLKPAFIKLATIATSEEEREFNAIGIQLVELEAGRVGNKFVK